MRRTRMDPARPALSLRVVRLRRRAPAAQPGGAFDRMNLLLLGGAALAKDPRHFELLNVARQLHEEGKSEFAVVAAQTACEVYAEVAIAELLKPRQLGEIGELIPELPGGYSLMDKRGQTLFHALTGRSIQRAAFGRTTGDTSSAGTLSCIRARNRPTTRRSRRSGRRRPSSLSRRRVDGRRIAARRLLVGEGATRAGWVAGGHGRASVTPPPDAPRAPFAAVRAGALPKALPPGPLRPVDVHEKTPPVAGLYRVARARIELATPRFSVVCSTN